MTDSTKVIVWDAVYTPFGQVHSITGTATNNQRFPGQYADAETGYSYNYFRDYDPSTGRYVQSDPIGLDGGLNTYGYVDGNPLEFIDPNGKACKKPGPCEAEVRKCIAAGRARGREGNGDCIAALMEGALNCPDEACVQNFLYKIPRTCGGGTRLPSECENDIQNCSYKQDPIDGRPPGRFNE
jgi:RHS repeat-associated protein